jgi:3-oxoadipate enol-lactonase
MAFYEAIMEKVTVNGVTLAYARQGSGVPLVLLHGYPLDHRIWAELAAILRPSFDLILPDLRGFGQSATVSDIYTVADMAVDVASLLDALNIGKAFIAGHSLGGYVALAFARGFPQRVLGLGLVSSQALADSPERKENRYATARQIAEQGVGFVAETMTPKLSAEPGTQALVTPIILSQKTSGLVGALKAMAERPDASALLLNCQFPLTIVHCAADTLIPVERAREIKALVPQAHLVELPGSGHLPMLDAPQATAAAFQAWL